jgi:hypothetical protein
MNIAVAVNGDTKDEPVDCSNLASRASVHVKGVDFAAFGTEHEAAGGIPGDAFGVVDVARRERRPQASVTSGSGGIG